MQAFQAGPTATSTGTSIHLALAGFADEIVGTLAHLFAYVGALALLAILGLAALGQLPNLRADEPALKPSWGVADRSHPAFALNRIDSSEKSAVYIILRHPGGGRRDVIRWSGEADRTIAELNIYRPGGEFDTGQPAAAILASLMGAAVPLEQAGLIDTKFGPVALFRSGGTAKGAPSCLGFLKRSDDPALQISGFSCQGGTLPAQRAAIACTLNRLTLLIAGNEPKLAELFAHAELRRRPCSPAGSPDWLLGVENAQLRGTL
ncbi:hypothetical protein QA641_00800 [Bradyrhizobium sp. CB1650]|uniref:hypothetical protein n=1 Tax=Bradyrhizobium sp. CB1650 TaxID=3039153 RepID=UPI002435D56C|nr:hypothetical protein [Bradyrhizobium sp. CB1650]WGD52525.1 hypothetical protein QA641_00800 [Bradyrhizobium sp. CB1650]